MSNLLTDVFFAPEEAEKLRVVENISLARLRELADAERDGRINISQYPNCGMCKLVTVDMFAKREPCKSCKSRALAEKGEAT